MSTLPDSASHQSVRPGMSLPESIHRVVQRFERMSREDKMVALVSLAKKLEPVPAHYLDTTDSSYVVPECQTPVRIFPEVHDGLVHFYADINARQSPTVAAFLSLVFGAVNDQPPAVTLAIPPDFVRTMMGGLGLGTREVGLDALVQRLKRHAREAQVAAGSPPAASDS